MLSRDDTSRMTGDCHVRFCERLAGAIPACLLGASLRPLRSLHPVNEPGNCHGCATIQT
jgi:hypothetical protein